MSTIALASPVPTHRHSFIGTASKWFGITIHSAWTLLACKLLIGLVSAFDIYLTIKFVDSLPMLEWNPIGRWLMALDSGPDCHLDQVASFIAAKFAGNFLALAIIELLGAWKRSLATFVALVVAALQVLLFAFLTQA